MVAGIEIGELKIKVSLRVSAVAVGVPPARINTDIFSLMGSYKFSLRLFLGS